MDTTGDSWHMRQLILSHRTLIKDLMINNSEVNLILSIKSKITARELADTENISIQLASQKLVKVWRMGYLERLEKADPTGGLYYEYAPHEDLCLGGIE